MNYMLIIALMLVPILALAQPYQPQVIWDRSGLQDSSAYGYKILPLGDQNDDGFADWAVLAHGNIATSDHGTKRPYLEFFHGSPSPDTVSYFIFQEDSPAYYQGWSAWIIGDLNGDGYEDWVSTFWPQGFPPSIIYGFFYGGHGPTSVPDVTWTISAGGFVPLADFDCNGDGYDDLYWRDTGTGESRLYYGGSQLDTIPDWIRYQPPPGMNNAFPAAAGDFNGDGASDFMCFNPNPPYNLAIFLGGANPDTVPAYFWSNQYYPDAGIDSLNGDQYDEWTSGACIHFGGPTLTPDCDALLNSSFGGGFGADAGDFNRDGYHDLIQYTWDTGTNPFGALDLHLGHPWLNPNPVFTIEGNSPPFHLRGIYTAVGLGDVNGDGLGDIAIGAFNETFGPWRGRCVILGGDSSLIASADEPRPDMPERLEVEAHPNPFNSSTTIELSLPPTNSLLELTLYNTLGQVAYREMLRPTSTTLRHTLRAEGLASGIYLLSCRAGNLTATKKLLLMK